MRKYILTLLTPLLLFATHGTPKIEDSAKGRDTILKVLTHEYLSGSLIEVKGAFSLIDPATEKKITSSFFKRRFYLSATPEGLKWGKVYKGIHQFQIVPSDSATSFLIDGIQYNGKLAAYDIASKIFLVVEVDVDSYLKSVLSEQFSYQDMHQTALEAVTIAMRTDIYQKIAASANPFWDIKAAEHGFHGTSLFAVNSAAEKAVAATKDLIMVYKNRPFPTTWTEDCAGKTAEYKTIYRKDAPCPPGVLVPFAQKVRSNHSWKCSIAKRELAEMLDLDSIQSIEPYKCPTTQKVYGLKINGRNLTFREVTFLDFQKMIGTARMQSNDFSISLIDKRIEFDGYGKGLGVGICILSAKEMAKAGKTTAKVLSAFYPETKLIKLEFVPQVFFDEGEIEDAE
jgi:SpoIID/LytB domain protein